jgi:hypothetical protein
LVSVGTALQYPDLNQIWPGGTESWGTTSGIGAADAVASLGERDQSEMLICGPTETPIARERSSLALL